jgi:hypothetical protein
VIPPPDTPGDNPSLETRGASVEVEQGRRVPSGD